jgi:hypothetical protein
VRKLIINDRFCTNVNTEYALPVLSSFCLVIWTVMEGQAYKAN